MRMTPRITIAALSLGLLAGAAACSTNVVGESGTTSGQHSTGAGGGNAPSTTDKIDLVLMIDNSASMADKQDILSKALPDLVSWLANPPCLDAQGVPAPKIEQPQSAVDLCPSGYHREFFPIRDMHIGVIDSSLGSGDPSSAICPETVANDPNCGGKTNTTNDDHGHLVTRLDPCSGEMASSYQGLGFLAWDPEKKLVPPGEADASIVAQEMSDLVKGVGQVGCGFEAPLEGIYRFLADPAPYQSLAVEGGKTVKQGVDDVLLKQRKDFLRPDSLLMILMLTDENDCSIQREGVGWVAVSTNQLPRARAICATHPEDACCASCGQQVDGCPDDPTCAENGGKQSPDEDTIYLRCFHEKRRFGIDFLYPTQRYVNALSKPVIDPSALDLAVAQGASGVPNPIFSDLDPADDDSKVRDPSLVVLAGLVGVPWQDVARDSTDLKKGFKTPAELTASGAWDAIAGDPDHYVEPTNPFMQESVGARAGTDPITNVAVTAPNGGDNAQNGHEWTPTGNTDLQYACTFPLVTPRDCTVSNGASCDCADPTNDNPLCAANPNDNGNRTLQVRAKAYPGVRELAVLKGLGDQAVVGSICPSQYDDPKATDYAYRPLVASLVEQAKEHFLPGN